MDGRDPHEIPSSRRRRVVRIVGAVAAGLAAVLWWWWPSLTRDPDRLDVLVLGVGDVREAAEPIQRRIREEGMSVEIMLVDPCRDRAGLGETVDTKSPAVVVLSPRSASCDWIELIDAARTGSDRRVIALAQEGALSSDDRSVLLDLDVTIADPARLLGPETVRRVGCLWWDDCDPDGQVTVRRPDGVLTDAGAQRVARVLTGNIP